MAATAGEAAATTAKVVRNFRIGQKKLFLPSHLITFIEPKRQQPPHQATFIVPLRFNKLDLRDYLYHVYNVEVTKVRSRLDPQPLEYRNPPIGVGELGKGPMFRPQPLKIMTVELVKPFVWPKAPAPEEREPWDAQMHGRIKADDKREEKHMEDVRYRNKTPMLDEAHLSNQRILLAREARELVEGRKVWKTDAKPDELWMDYAKVQKDAEAISMLEKRVEERERRRAELEGRQKQRKH